MYADLVLAIFDVMINNLTSMSVFTVLFCMLLIVWLKK